jgi:hypothetical protein
MESLSPTGLPSKVKDIVDAVMYLTDAATVTGHILYVDGGDPSIYESIHYESKATLARRGIRARKIGGTTIRSISDSRKNQRLKDNNKESVDPLEMISELRDDNLQLTRSLRRHTRFATTATMSPPRA